MAYSILVFSVASLLVPLALSNAVGFILISPSLYNIRGISQLHKRHMPAQCGRNCSSYTQYIWQWCWSTQEHGRAHAFWAVLSFASWQSACTEPLSPSLCLLRSSADSGRNRNMTCAGGSCWTDTACNIGSKSLCGTGRGSSSACDE